MRIEYPIDGIFLLDKPLGMTSNAVLQKVKRLFQAKKAGHTGSLDPLASGMLPICFGEATKFSQFLLDEDKYYRVEGLLGIKTSTGDREGEVIETQDPQHIHVAMLQEHVEKFQGELWQCPPMYSALKVDGVALYKLARQGITIERQSRPVTIYKSQLLSANLPYFELDVWCSKGTYIRTLIEDIGQSLGCGAHVTKLRRLSVAGFQPEGMHTIEDLEKASTPAALKNFMLPIEAGLGKIPSLSLNIDQLNALRCGKKVGLEYHTNAGLYRIYDENNNQFIGLIDADSEGILKVHRLCRTGGHDD